MFHFMEKRQKSKKFLFFKDPKIRPGEVIRGMLHAVEGMCVGEELSVVVPPHMAYDDPSLSMDLYGAV